MKPSWGQGWSVGLRIWVERGGEAILGQGRLELLEGIERWHSISAAARHLKMSYRRAWELVQSINRAAGEALVISATGGTKGGGAQLTPLGHWAVGAFRDVQDQIRRSAAATVPALLGHADPAVLHVAAASSLENVLRELLADYALREPTLRVHTIFGSSDELATHILAGAPAAGLADVIHTTDSEDALDNVVDGTANCAIIDGIDLEAYKTNKPGRAKLLKTLLESEPFPSAVIAYNPAAATPVPPAVVESFRKGLIAAQTTPQGKKLLETCRITSFEAMPENYDKIFADIAKAYPPPAPPKK